MSAAEEARQLAAEARALVRALGEGRGAAALELARGVAELADRLAAALAVVPASVSVAEAAALAGVCEETIRRAIRAGELRAWSSTGEGRRPRNQRIAREELARWTKPQP